MTEGSLLTTDPSVAAAALINGQLAVVPTETVYGLAADANQPFAIQRLFAVKGRPLTHPVIVHVASLAAARHWVADIPPAIESMLNFLWPGPLTVVLPRSARAIDDVTGGQDTVALRCSAHPTLQTVLATMIDTTGDEATAVVAPSANVFGSVSATSARDALENVGARLVPGSDAILDGGACDIGIESTIVDCTTSSGVRILRSGFVTDEQIDSFVPIIAGRSAVRAPGTLAAHYSPRANVVLSSANEYQSVQLDGSVGLIAPASVSDRDGAVRIASPTTTVEYARELYAALHEVDRRELDHVLVVPPDPTDGLAVAIGDRLRRAAAG